MMPNILAHMIDLRSDTVTTPSPAMKAFMLECPVGDDVFGEDPTVTRLESLAASMFGMEAALFCPSGTMTNQIAIKAHTQPGEEVICDELSHVYQYEGGGIAFNALCATKLLKGNMGLLKACQIEEAINNPLDVHKPKTTLVSLENTSNRGGGSCYEMDDLNQIADCCRSNHLKLHLDGARLFNALVAKKQQPCEYGKIFDSISICLSKGLGAPVGSLLLGTGKFITQSRRIRKVLGGGMRQAGIMAGAALYALENNVERLAIDHQHAGKIAEALRRKDFVKEVVNPQTNIVLFKVSHTTNAAEVVNALKQQGVLCLSINRNTVRMVTHLDLSAAMISDTIEAINKLYI